MSHTTTRRARGARRRQSSVAALAAAALAATGVLTTAAVAGAAPGPEATLVVEADQPFRPVSHVATGSLYGIADAGVPSDDLIAPIKPNTFMQMPPRGTQQPTGDTLDVWETAARHGAGVVVRLCDYYPGWPYRFTWEDTGDRLGWENAVRQIVADVEASGATNIVAYAPWNESDQTWLEQNGSFEELWQFTYELLREIAPDVPIQGPSFSDNIADMRQFLEFAVETDTVPDVLEWHELIRPSKIKGDIETVEGILADLGISPRPIDIAEYGSPQEVGLPGVMANYIAKLERHGVDRAELAFWNQSGTLGDLLTHRGGDPNGAYWLYTWYAAMSGDMVTTTPPSNESPLDGAAAVTAGKDEVHVIAGGGTGPTSIVVNGLDALDLGEDVDVTLEVSPSYGRTVATPAPITVSRTTYEVGDDGSITVPVVMNPAYGYRVVVQAAGEAESLAGRYTITNGNSGLALDVADEATPAGTPAVQAAADGDPTQTWELVDAGRGLYRVVNTASGLALGVADAARSNGAAAVVREDAGDEDQLWQAVPDGHGRVRLANAGTGLTLAVADTSTEPGAAVVQWTDGSPTSGCRADGPRQPGRIGTAIDFCRSDSYVQLPDGVVSGLDGDWSVSTWVKPAAVTTWTRVFDFGRGQSANMFLTVNAGSGPRFAITAGGAGGEQRLSYNGQHLPLGQWSLVTVVVEGTTGTMYLDGRPVATGTITTSPADLGLTNRNYLGKSQYSSDPPFDGAIDDFAVYGRALSAAEVAELASGQPAAGDVVSYAFDETTDLARVVDSSGNGRTGRVTAGTTSSGTTTATDEQTPDRFWTLTPAQAPDTTAPQVTVKEGEQLTRGADGRYAKVSFKLHDEGKVDRLTLNGVEKDLTDDVWSDLNGVVPGVFGAVEGRNTLVVRDVAGNTTTVTFVLDTTGPQVTVKDGESFTVGADGTYSRVSYKLHDPAKVDRLTLNGVVKDLTDNTWSDLNHVVPGAFGAVEGENTLVVLDSLGNATTVVFTLTR